MKRIVLMLLPLLLFTSLTVSASAHSGRTDYKGGHTDHSTGEYHYHHGYPAHEHTDLDGDGIPDCPYDFEDKTDHSSGSSHSSVSSPCAPSSSVTSSPPRVSPSPSPITAAVEAETDGANTPYWFYASLPVIAYSAFKIKKKRKQKKIEQEKQRRIAEEEKKLFAAEKEKYQKQYGNVSTLSASDAPPSCFVGGDGLPAVSDKSGEKWGKDYTFYISSSGKCFHKKTCRYVSSTLSREINAATIARRDFYGFYRGNYDYSPCSFCRPVLPDMKWYKKYMDIQAIREKYDIPEPTQRE